MTIPAWLHKPYNDDGTGCYGCGLQAETMNPHRWALCFWCNELRLLLEDQLTKDLGLDGDYRILRFGADGYVATHRSIGLGKVVASPHEAAEQIKRHRRRAAWRVPLLSRS